ncbi:hypothetical protein [Amorphus sp. 3PC139-8]|uniref:hypothetical protein n=1 Tax=Amorphus sp. 3PC139-8 TaxID=2735676 RepID=UPI00345D5153
MLAGFSLGARADCNCSFIADQHKKTQDIIGEDIKTATEALIDELRLKTQQDSAYSDRQVEAKKRIEDGAQQNETQRMREKYRIKAENEIFDPSPTACSTYDLYKAGIGGGGSGPNGFDMANAVWDRSRCKSGEAVCAGGVALAKEILQSSLSLAGTDGFADPTTNAQIIFGKPTMNTSDQSVAAAASRFMVNLAYPFPLQPVTGEQAATPQGAAIAAERKASEAMVSTALTGLGFWAAYRTPISPKAAQAMRQHKPENYTREIPQSVSEHQFLEYEVLRRFGNPEWLILLGEAQGEKPLLEEGLKMMALGLRLQYLQVEAEMRNGLMLAALVGNAARNSPQLALQR